MSARAKRYPAGAYVRTAADGPAMVAISRAARANVEAYVAEYQGRFGAPNPTEVFELERVWLEVFWRRYFALEGRQGELVRLGHPVRCAQRELNGLGFPDSWKRMLAVGAAQGRANGMTNGGTAEEPVRADPPEVLLAAARRARVAREPATEVAS